MIIGAMLPLDCIAPLFFPLKRFMMNLQHTIRTLLWLLCLSALPTMAQRIEVSTTEGAPNDEVTVQVNITDAPNVSALQMAIPLDEHLTYVSNSAQLNAARSDGHTLSAGVKDGQLRFYLYALSMKALKEGENPLFTFRLKLDKSPGSRMLQVTDVIATDTEGNTITDITTAAGSVTTRCALAEFDRTLDYGRVPLQATHTQSLRIRNTGTSDLVITELRFSSANYQTNIALPLTITAHDQRDIPILFTPQQRGEQEATLEITSNSVSTFKTVKLQSAPYAVNELHVASGLQGNSDTEIEVPLLVNNMDALCGFQLEFDLPEQLSYVEGSFRLSERANGHQLSSSCKKQHVVMLAYSPTNTPFKGNDGCIATFRVKLNGPYGCTLEASKAILSALIEGEVMNVTSANEGCYVDIFTPSLSLDTWGDIDMGRTPVTEDSKATLTLHNDGNADLKVERITLRNGTPIATDCHLPLVIKQYESQTITFTYNTLDKGDFADVVQIYCNDPRQRLVEKNISGYRYEPNEVNLRFMPTSTPDSVYFMLSLANYNPMSGIQFDFDVPYGFSLPDDGGMVLQNRFANYTLNKQQLPTGQYRVFIYSLNDETVTRGESDVLRFALQPDEPQNASQAELSLYNIKVGSPEMTDVGSYATSLYAKAGDIVISQICASPTNSSNQAEGIYTLSGIKVGKSIDYLHNLPAGIYLLKDKNRCRKIWYK